MKGLILQIDPTSANYVINRLPSIHLSKNMLEFMINKNHMCVIMKDALRPSVKFPILSDTRGYILERNHFSVSIVQSHLVPAAISSSI